MHSHHSHSGQFCTHAVGELEECIKEAISQKFELFCLTEHIPRYQASDLYPGETQTLQELMDMFSRYYKHARSLQKEYRDDLQILVGLETEYIREEDLQRLQNLITEYPVDMMVGSVHHVNAVPIDFDADMWRMALESCRNEEDFYGRYFDHQYRIIETLRPDIIGHFDVILLFAPAETDLLQWQSVEDKIMRNIAAVVKYGGLFELNSSAFRKGWSTAYPRPNIVELIKGQGGQFCLSDDSHGPHQVGLNYHRLQAYVRAMGITKLAKLERRGAPNERGVYSTSIMADEQLLSRFETFTPRQTD